jgi:hypothetical protein
MNPLLQTHFGFSEDPFNPARDPDGSFDFAAYSLKNGLRIFEQEKLTRYYIEKACFKECLDKAKDFLAGRTANQGPPVFLIEGLRDSGVESLANYVAWMIRGMVPGNTAGFDTASLAGENFADWLSNILISLRLYLEDHPAIRLNNSILSLFPNPQAPAPANEAILGQIMISLGQRLRNMPWLILSLNSISFDQQGRMKRLAELLTPMNIAPIFLTADGKVTTYFKALFGGNGCPLRLRPLEKTEGVEILIDRMGGFRPKLPAGTPDLYPYEQDAIDYLFSDGAKVMGYLLEVCEGSLKETLADIASGKTAPSQVTWGHVQRCIRERLRRVPPERKG